MDSIVLFGIGGLALIVAAAVAAMVRISDPQRFPKILAVLIAVMAIQFALAQSGLLHRWDRTPPPFAPMMLITLILTIVLAFSRVGDAMIRRLPIETLIGFQVFRLPLELVMHRAATHGIMPPQMTFSGYNFDILSGALALPVAWLASRSRLAVIAWNIMGSALLATILVIAILSTPPIAGFGPDHLNTFIADPPYVWLPGILVPSALLGHLLLWRRLARPSQHA